MTNSILAGATNRQALARREESFRSFSIVSPPLLSTMSQFAGELSSELQNGPVLAEESEDPSEIHILNAEASGELILLVDDEMEISALASAMLCDEGYKVILAKEGFEALRITGSSITDWFVIRIFSSVWRRGFDESMLNRR